MAGQPKKFKSAKDLQNAIDKYKQYLEDEKKPPTIAGLAYYTGINRTTIYNYSKKDEYFNTIKEFRDWIIMNYEELAISQNSTSGVIFLLKNYGYTDKQEITHEGTLQIRTDIIEKYLKNG
jgi:hypothetical protein